MASPAMVIDARYQIQEIIPGGGMGIVYKAYDRVAKRHVALKTMRGALNDAALELFLKEWTVLANLCHPNIVDMLDKGEFDEDGQRKPYFVMPFLRGRTLEYLIAHATQRLTVERVVEIISQTCRGLQAAHEAGVVHRDLKPSNIFVMDDDTVKIIDFGVVHLTGTDSITGLKGTLQYMAPEQIEMKPCTAASDIFSLSVVCYEAFTGRKPFLRKTESETVDAIRRHIPPPVSELNPLVNQLLSRVVHKAMAKAPWHRFSTAREYAETLQKGLNNQPVERFERAKLQPRILRAKKAQMEGDLQFALEILTELEAEGNIDPEMTLLRIQIDQGIRQKSVRQLLDSARTRLEEDEFPLALQKIQEVLNIDPENPEALGLKAGIERRRSESQIENWFRLFEQHIHNHSFSQAKQALQEILKIDPTHSKARELATEVERREEEINRLRAEKERLYQSALSSYQQGEISSALSKLERVLEVNRRSPDSAFPARDAQYEDFYNQIRTEKEAARNSYDEGRRSLADRNFAKTLEICNEFLKKAPGDPMFQALKLEAEEQERQEQSSFIADVARRIEAEPDLDRRVNILKEAADRYPAEAHFQQSLRLTRGRRDLVNGIVAKARQWEERGQFAEALSQWDILRNIYAPYPGIDFEIERVKRRRDEQVSEEGKGRWVEQIDRNIAAGDYTRARDLARTAMGEFPDDRELEGLDRIAQAALERAGQAQTWLQSGLKLCADKQFAEGLEALRKAAALDNRNPAIRLALLGALVEQARSVLAHQDWRAAEPLIQQALSLDAGHPDAKNLMASMLDCKRHEIVNESISRAREMQAAGDLDAALAIVESAIISFPSENRLVQLRTTLRDLADEPAIPEMQQLPAAPPMAALPLIVPPPAHPGKLDSTENDTNYDTLDDTLPSTSYRRGPEKMEEPGTLPVVVVDQAQPTAGVLPAVQVQGPGKQFILSRLSPFQWGAVGVFLLVVLLAVFARSGGKPKIVPPGARDFPVGVEANVPGATFLIDGHPAASFPVRLRPGDHKAEAVLLGYRAEPIPFKVLEGARQPYSIMFHLEPEPLSIRFSSDLKTGQVSLDGEPPIELREGAFSKDGITPSAEHKLTLLQSGAETFSFSFRAEPGGIAILSSPMRGKDVDAFVVSNLGPQARVYAKNTSLKARLNDNPPVSIPDDGLLLSNLNGNTELTVIDGDNNRSLPLRVGKVPALDILVASDRTTATLRIESNVPNADVTINGRKYNALKQGVGRFFLPPGVYKISLAKEGYTSEDRTVELKKGEVQPLPRFELKPVIRTASLVIEGGTAGAEVWIDGSLSGSLNADGAYTRDSISPESHAVVFKKTDFEDKGLQKTFAAGQALHLTGAEAQLTPFGSIALRITPQNAGVTLQRQDEGTPMPVENGKTVKLRAGRYIVSASASDRMPRQDTVDVEAGKPQNIEWVLPPIAPIIKTPPPPPKTTADYFRNPESWTVESGWTVHRGEGVSFLRGNEGVYEMRILRPGSKKTAIQRKSKRAEWIIDEKDPGNLIDYFLDSGGLERKNFVNQKAVSTTKKIPIAVDEVYRIRIEIRPEKIVISSNGIELDNFPRPPGVPLGAFGFRGDIALQIDSGPDK